MTRAQALIRGLPAGWLIADTAFDADQFRRIATRYEKTATNFLAMIHLAATMVWLR